MIGAVTPGSLLVWARASGSACRSRSSTRRDSLPGDAAHAGRGRARRRRFHRAYRLPGLSPATRYWYRVLLDGRRPATDACHMRRRRRPRAERRSASPLAPARACRSIRSSGSSTPCGGRARPVLLAGRQHLRRQRAAAAAGRRISAPAQRRALEPLLASVPQLATWDDHDFGLNNSDRTYSARAARLSVFRNYWANPGAGFRARPECSSEYQYGGVDFFFLDGRYHRDPNPRPTGRARRCWARHKAWLKDGLRASRAPFKVLVSGSGWSMGDGPQGDTWAAFRHERDELFDFIRDQRIGGVVLLSGDTHVGELNCIRWSERGGYDFYDLVSSPLAQATSLSFAARRRSIACARCTRAASTSACSTSNGSPSRGCTSHCATLGRARLGAAHAYGERARERPLDLPRRRQSLPEHVAACRRAAAAADSPGAQPQRLAICAHGTSLKFCRSAGVRFRPSCTTSRPARGRARAPRS